MNRRSPARRHRIVVLGLVGALVTGPRPPARAQGTGGDRIRQQEQFQGSNVLSPGKQDDWPIRVRDGETLIVSVTSRAFDPAVRLVGPGAEVVAENDDVRRGQQDALMLARVAAGGEYRVRVVASDGATGGQYGLTVRRFVAADLPSGARTTGSLGKGLARWYRFEAAADRTLVIGARATSFVPGVQVFAPDGEPVAAEAAGGPARGSTRLVFRAPVGGSYYARVGPPPGQGGDPRASFAVTLAAARVIATAVGDAPARRRVEAGGLDLWAFQGRAGDLVRARVKAASGELSAQIAYVPPADATGRPQGPEGPVSPLVVLPSDPKAGGEVVALLNVAGAYQVAVSQPLGVASDYTFSATRPARPLADDPAPGGTLGLGGSDFWAVDGAAGRVVSVEGASERFDAELELFGPQGDLVARDDDGGPGRGARLTALLAERGRYVLRVHAHGDGGAGPYTLRRVPEPARPLTPGGLGEGTVGAGGREVWSFPGKAGQTVILSARSPDFNVRLALFGADAAEVAADDDGGEGTDSLLSARLPADGNYTVWVTSAAGGGGYSLQLIEAR